MCEHDDTVPLVVLIPADHSHTGEFRWASKPVDRCIAPIVQALNAAGIYTVNACCGHGKGLRFSKAGSPRVRPARVTLGRPFGGAREVAGSTPALCTAVSPLWRHRGDSSAAEHPGAGDALRCAVAAYKKTIPNGPKKIPNDHSTGNYL